MGKAGKDELGSRDASSFRLLLERAGFCDMDQYTMRGCAERSLLTLKRSSRLVMVSAALRSRLRVMIL